MTNIHIVEDIDALESACNRLSEDTCFAIDTEFMREKTYAPILCLIQVASRDFSCCIDPLSLDSLDPFLSLLETKNTETILHSCRQDFEAFDTRSTRLPYQLFDTQIAAAFCGYGDQVSYAAMVEKVCDVKLAKSHTRADWSARPLSQGELDYAMDDVLYLHAVRDFLQLRLQKFDRMSWFEDECARQLNPRNWQVDPQMAWQKLKGAMRLPAVAHQTAKQLAIWREQQAIKRNRPREWILATKSLLEIARLAPDNGAKLGKIEGVNQGVVRQSAAAIIEICASTCREKDAESLWSAPDMLAPEQKQKVKAVMTDLRSIAEELNLASSLLANRNTVEKFVRGNHDLELFKGWRKVAAGDRILEKFT